MSVVYPDGVVDTVDNWMILGRNAMQAGLSLTHAAS